MEILFFALCFGFIAAAIVRSKGYPQGDQVAYFIFGALLAIVAIPVALLKKPHKQQTASVAPTKRCPSCAETIHADAAVCRYCNRETITRCPYCAEVIQPEAKVCRWCNRDLAVTGETHP